MLVTLRQRNFFCSGLQGLSRSRAIISFAGLAGVVIVDVLTYLLAAVLILFINVTSQPI